MEQTQPRNPRILDAETQNFESLNFNPRMIARQLRQLTNSVGYVSGDLEIAIGNPKQLINLHMSEAIDILNSSLVVLIFPQQRKLAAIVKVPEQVGAAKIPLRKVPRFPERASQARGSQWFPSKVPQEEVPQEEVPKISQARFPSKVPRNRFPKFPNIRKNRFRSKVPKSRFTSKVPMQGFQG